MDLVEREIGFIDERLAEEGSLQEIIFSRSPLLVCAVGLIAGILLQWCFDFPGWVWFSVVVFCAILCGVIMLRKDSERRVFLVAYIACAGFAGLGGVRVVDFYSLGGDDIAHIVGEREVFAKVRGSLCTNVRLSNNKGWKFGKFAFGGSVSSFYMDVEEILSEDNEWRTAGGKIRVQVQGRVSGVDAGGRVEMYCELGGFGGAGNPGGFDFAKYLRNRGVHVGASVRSVSGLKVIDKGGGAFVVRVRKRLRAFMSERLLGEGFSDERGAGLVEALVLGQRGKIDGETYEAFRKTNLAHFISLSGMHMGMLVGFLWCLSHLMQLEKRWRGVFCIVLMVLYLLVIPTRAPSLRAAIIAGVFLMAVIMRRRGNIVNSISLAAILLLLWRPCDLFNAGWQLSFVSVLAIICFENKIEYWLIWRWGNWLGAMSQRGFWGWFFAGIIKRGGQLLSVGIAAWIGTCGIILYHFGTIALLSSVWTVLVFPLVLGVVMLGFVGVLFSFVLPTVGVIVGMAVGVIAETLVVAVRFIASIDNLQVHVGRVGVWLVVCYYVWLVLGRFWYCRRRVLKKAVMRVMFVILAVGVFVAMYEPFAKSKFRVTCLDVGHGQAIVVQLAGGRNVMFDAGSLMKSNCGGRVVNPFLRASGIGKLDALFLSHDDVDHINGVPEIAGSCKVSNVFVNDGFINAVEGSRSARFLEECLEDRGLELKSLDSEILSSQFPEISIIWPTGDVCGDASVSDNDKAMVVLLEYAGRKMLICSDIERFGQEEILRANPGLKVDVIVMPHHGSKTNLVDGFVEKLGAETIIVSCSERRQKTAYKGKRTVKSFYTATDGAISVTVDAKGNLSFATFLSKGK
ncbi:MAG: DNA internalization-related competence protein ComEC/Rec2 [Planctomycetes bacterium]|nr:DNA internalization-related competence protein ComEC/Rec2 [Planctomycetota bacterium]